MPDQRAGCATAGRSVEALKEEVHRSSQSEHKCVRPKASPRATHRIPQQPSSRVPSFQLDWVEPRTFRRQKKGQNAHPFALSLDLLVLLSDPGPHLLAVMPGGIIPDQKPASLALLLQSSADPLQKLGGDGADRTPIHKTQRHLMAHRRSDRTVLPKHPIAGKGLWIRIILLPDIERGQSEAAPPHLIQKADGPTWLRARGTPSAGRVRFF